MPPQGTAFVPVLEAAAPAPTVIICACTGAHKERDGDIGRTDSAFTRAGRHTGLTVAGAATGIIAAARIVTATGIAATTAVIATAVRRATTRIHHKFLQVP